MIDASRPGMSASTSAWSGERVAKPARADSIRSRVKGEAGPAANNPGLRAVLRRHAPSATRQRTLEANGIDCGAGPSRGVSLRSERRRAFQDNMRHDRLSQDDDDEFPVDRGPGVGGSPAGVLGHDVHDGGRDCGGELAVLVRHVAGGSVPACGGHVARGEQGELEGQKPGAACALERRR